MDRLIGLVGQKRVGKNTFAALINSFDPTIEIAFADGIKDSFCELFNVSRDWIEKWKDIPEPPSGWGMSVRQALQFIGDGFRKIKSDVWLSQVAKKVEQQREQSANAFHVLTDIRYINEMIIAKKLGGVNILLYRPGFLNDNDHPSEAQVRPIVQFLLEYGVEGEVPPVLNELQGVSIPEGTDYIDLFIRNDGTIEDLRAKLNNIILPYIQKVFGG